MNLYELFHETAARHPNHPAIVGPAQGTCLTYGELDREIRSVSDGLVAVGVRPGDCVGLHCLSGAEYIALNYAAWRCKACVVPIAPELTPPEKQDVCRQISLQCVISSGATAPFARFRRHHTAYRKRRVGKTAVIVAVESPWPPPSGCDTTDSAFIRFTSGTTGAFKGVVLSHASVYDRICAANEALMIGPSDRVVWLLSMSYHFTVSIVSYLTFGATIILPKNHFAGGVVDAARHNGATLIYASAAQYRLMADYRDGGPVSSLRLVISTTTALDSAVARKFADRYGLPVTQALGIIEVGLPCINVDFARQKPDSVGRVLPAYKLKLADIGLGPNQGEILFRGKGFLDAYYRPWRLRGEIMPDSWFHTGDVGELDADGCLYLRGRIKDIISVAGMKVFPREVENVLMAHPSVAEACVFGREHPRLGEVAHARIVARQNANMLGIEEDLKRWCARRLAAYKVPETIAIVDALSRTASGKVLHRDATPAEC